MSLVPNISPAIGGIPYSFNMCQHFYQLSSHLCDDRFITSNFCCFFCDDRSSLLEPYSQAAPPCWDVFWASQSNRPHFWLQLVAGPGSPPAFRDQKKSGPCRFEVHEIDALQIDVLDDFEFDTLLIHVDIYIYIASVYVLNMDQRCHLQAIEFAGWVIGQEPYYLIV